MREGCRHGKLRGLAWLLNEHGEAVEADLLREYNVDLLDLYRGRLSLRRIWVLIEGLTPDCQTSRRVAGISEIYDEWSQTDLLLGRLLEVQIEEEVLPREKTTTGSTKSRQRDDIPLVSPTDMKELINATPEMFGEAHAH